MTENSKIEWCDATWQVTHGCRAIAPGCANCYAIRDAHRMAGHPNPKISGPRHGLTRRRDNGLGRTVWTGVVRTAPENLAIPLRWKKPKRIFVNSNSDLFHEDVPFEFIAAVYGVMAACPRHRFIILTKRPKRMREFFEWAHSYGGVNDYIRSDVGRPLLRNIFNAVGINETTNGKLHRAANDPWMLVMNGAACWMGKCPLPNVIHGYSAANQADLDAGIADLLATPSALRCLSLEPLIGPVDLSKCITCRCDKNGNCDVCLSGGIDWVITGGESGPGARPCDVAWIRSIVAQCRAAGVPCFVKQLGVYPVNDLRSDAVGIHPTMNDAPSAARAWERGDYGRRVALKDRKGADPSEWPADLRVRQWPEVTHG